MTEAQAVEMLLLLRIIMDFVIVTAVASVGLYLRMTFR